MNTYKINQLKGDARENAIDTVITAVARKGWGWNHDDNRDDAYELALALEVLFDENGNSNPSHR